MADNDPGWLVAGGWLRLVAVDGSTLALSISGQHSHLPAQTFRPQLDYGLLQLFTTLHFIRLGWICGQTITMKSSLCKKFIVCIYYN